jgi:hypothetical protein
MLRALWLILVKAIKKGAAVGLIDFSTSMLLAPSAMFFGWLTLSNIFQYTYGSITYAFSPLQWMIAYTISGYFLLSILFYIIRLPFIIFCKLRIKALEILDQEHGNDVHPVICPNCTKLLWLLGDESAGVLRYTPKKYIFAALATHYAAVLLYAIGIFCFFMLVGAMVATLDFSVMDMLSLGVMSVSELVKNVF